MLKSQIMHPCSGMVINPSDADSDDGKDDHPTFIPYRSYTLVSSNVAVEQFDHYFDDLPLPRITAGYVFIDDISCFFHV